MLPMVGAAGIPRLAALAPLCVLRIPRLAVLMHGPYDANLTIRKAIKVACPFIGLHAKMKPSKTWPDLPWPGLARLG